MSKKTKIRDCPAAGKPITSAECGEGRHTKYACPEQCPFNPFSAVNYDQFSGIENNFDAKLLEWIADHVADRKQFESEMQRMLSRENEAELMHYLAWQGIYRADSEGETCIGRWAKAGFVGLSSDERILARARQEMRPAILEAHRILDDRRVECVDLLDPSRRPVLVVDRGLASQAVRFGAYMAHLVPLPHYHRIFGIAVAIPSLFPFNAEDVIREITRHLGGPSVEVEVRRWLAEHYARFQEAVLAVVVARRRAMLEKVDAQFGKAVYQLQCPYDECRQLLDSVVEIAPDPLSDQDSKEGFAEARVWFAKTTDAEREHAIEGATLGRVLLGQSHWRLDTMGAGLLEKLRQRFEALMQDKVRFTGERRDDLAARLKGELPAYNADLVPLELLKNPPELVTSLARVPVPQGIASLQEIADEQILRADKEFMDQPVPALGNKSPRQAAADLAMRPSLIRLMKHWVRQADEETLESGRPHDVTWMLRELGLNEILFEPPPPRRPLGPPEESEIAMDQVDTRLPGTNLAPPPPLPARPWTKDEAFAVFERATTAFPKAAGALDYLVTIEYPLFADLDQLTQGLLEPREFQFLVPLLATLVLCFAPPGTRPPALNVDQLASALELEAGVMEAYMTHPGMDLEPWINQTPQPELVKVSLAWLMALAEEVPRKLRPPDKTMPILFILTRVVIDGLDRGVRHGL